MATDLHPFLLLTLALLAKADWLDGNDGVDRPNGDLPGMPVALKNGSAPQDCAAMCRGSAECEAWAFLKQNCGGNTDRPQCFLKAAVTNQVKKTCLVSGLKGPLNLVPLKYRPFPVGAIEPTGWLLSQLQLQADSLSGHLPLFWADVMNSSWIGGKADTYLHERAPYWLNGFLPLAYQLKNQTLIAIAQKYVDYILSHQTAEGWLGPDDVHDGNQYWSKYLVMMILRQYHEANASDARVLPAMMKFFKVAYSRMFDTAFGNTWSGARWQDFMLSIHWMLENDPMGQEQMLWDLAELVHRQGFDWKGFYGNDTFPTEAVGPTTLYTHGVNNGMAYKSEAVWYRQSGNFTDVESSYVRMEKMDRFHGQASGIFACDEHLAGKMPSRGTELCTVVETMFSFETLCYIHGDPVFAERAEQLAYNALPATITPDMWAHQYLQQSNEMNAVHSNDHIWTHDGPDSTLFGLAPNYGCCTANFNQGWPKFAQHLMMELGSQVGVAILMYSPARLQYTLPDGVPASVEIATDYPFDGGIAVTAFCGAGMTLALRIPSWTFDPVVTVNKTAKATPPPEPGTMYEILCSWNTVVNLSFPMHTVVKRRYNNAASIYRGPLLYGLHMNENSKVLRNYSYDSKDYQVTTNSSWNYALYLPSNETADQDLAVVVRGMQTGHPPFSYEGTPVMINAKGRVLDSWTVAHNAADAPPMSPVKSTNPLTPITLIPFGATNLRIAEIPTLAED